MSLQPKIEWVDEGKIGELFLETHGNKKNIYQWT